MRIALGSFLMMVAAIGLFSATASAGKSVPVQTSACYPNTPEAKNWPVSIIYMHGLFEPGGESPTEFRGLERSNRAMLAQFAKDHPGVRIAVPLAPVHGQWRSWNKVGLKNIEKMASAACGGAALATNRDLVGFSNGAITAQKFTCDETEAYAHVFCIGAAPYQTSGGTKSCHEPSGRFEASTVHDFAKGFHKFTGQLAQMGRKSVVESGAVVDRKKKSAQGNR